MSHGMIVARSIASHEIPAAAARSHAFSITCTCPPEGTRGRRGAAVSRDARRVGAGRARRAARRGAGAVGGEGACAPHATTVTCEPSTSTSAEPSGSV